MATRTTSPELLLAIDRSRPRSLRVQIEDELRSAIQDGRLAPGARLPSTRALAADLDVTRGVVVAAYDQLVAEGYLASQHGSGTIVNPTARPGHRRRPLAVDEVPVLVDFHTGRPDLELFPRSAWLRATRSAMATMPDSDLGYIDPRGLVALRVAVADYLGRVRGVRADPDQIVVCNGFGHGLSLVASALRSLGHGEVAVEDPGYDGARKVLAHAGLRHRGVAVDDDGLVAALLPTSARAVVVTPAHHNPTGVVLSPGRRQELVAWANDVDGYVIEDDYDAEYRYDRHPAGAVQGLDPERVVYCGTTSKSLAPALRLGWLAVPRPLVEPIVQARWATDSATSSITQAAFAHLLVNGDVDRHLRRMRRVYRHRRDALVEALGRWLPELVPLGASAGLQLLVRLPDDLDEAQLVDAALAAGVRVYPLAPYRSSRRRGVGEGLALGYGCVRPDDAEAGVRRLSEVVAALRARDL